MTLQERIQHVAQGCLLHHDHHDHGERDLEKRGLIWFPFAGADLLSSRGMPHLTEAGRALLTKGVGK